MTVWHIGPNRQYTKIDQVASMYGVYRLEDGDTILLDAGEYVGDPMYLHNAVTVKSVGGRARLFYKDRYTTPRPGHALTYTGGLCDVNTARSGIAADRTKRVDIYDVDFIGAGAGLATNKVDNAGIRMIAGNLHVHNCRFINNANGIMTANETTDTLSELHMDGCEILGGGGDGSGYAHNIYVGQIAKFIMENCYSHGVKSGHVIKSRAKETQLWYNRFTDESGWASSIVDLSNGGLAIVVGNLIHKWIPSNSKTIGYAAEGYTYNGISWPVHEFYCCSNTIVCDINNTPLDPPKYVYINENVLLTNRKIMNNVAYGAAGTPVWPTTTGFSNNFNLVADDLPNKDTFDYRLDATRGWSDTYLGADPGTTTAGVSLTPTKEYVHPRSSATVTTSPFHVGALQTVNGSIVPSWAPAAGQLKTISHPAGYYGDKGGATLAEIDPIYQTWHPLYGSGYSYSLPFGFPNKYAGWSQQNAYCGYVLNTDSRQLVHYGSGHDTINVPAPYAFDLNDLKWKWLDTPLPFDGYQLAINLPWPLQQAAVEVYYPPEQLDFSWGELQGSWTGWSTYARPGIIQPVSGHSRSSLVHIPASSAGNTKGKLLYITGPTGKTGGANSSTSHMFDYDTSLWSRNTNRKVTTDYRAVGSDGGVHDAVTNKVVRFGGANYTVREFDVFDVATRTWSVRTASASSEGNSDHGGNVLHTASRLFITPSARSTTDTATTSGVSYKFYATSFDAIVGTGSFYPTALTVYVTSTWPLNGATNTYIGWQYCPDDKCLYAVSGANGTNKYWRLAPPVGAVSQSDYLTGTWTLTENTFTSGSFVASTVIFAYQRLRWDAQSKAFIWHSGGVNDPVMAWRPAAL